MKCKLQLRDIRRCGRELNRIEIDIMQTSIHSHDLEAQFSYVEC